MSLGRVTENSRVPVGLGAAVNPHRIAPRPLGPGGKSENNVRRKATLGVDQNIAARGRLIGHREFARHIFANPAGAVDLCDPRLGFLAERAAFAARVKNLMEDVPDLPNFSRFHDGFRENPKGASNEGHMREPFFMAYDESNCEFIKLASKEVDERLKKGPEMVSANFVIPYPPGFPIMVPGQVITEDTITFMRKLDVKEIHGYHAAQGLKLIKPEKLCSPKKSAK